ncbi:hypothetical protein [Streptomyces sp. NBC_00258]|uniref:hypothetical protein n=1 Tax=Streptomyces sp. NBC_00258 TaxID=2903642 RepID=UPI002E2C8E4C|nr:hypothetical protein [Streptomyces sp. NBC_00258]
MMIAAPQAVDRARQIVLAYAPLMVTVRQVMYGRPTTPVSRPRWYERCLRACGWNRPGRRAGAGGLRRRCRGNAHAWYRQCFGHPAAYDRLLDALTSTPYERQAMLRSYFEPDDQEREAGLKQPTAAHHAIARLVAAGHVR